MPHGVAVNISLLGLYLEEKKKEFKMYRVVSVGLPLCPAQAPPATASACEGAAELGL